MSGQDASWEVKGLFRTLKNHWAISFIVENQDQSKRH